MLIVVVLGIFGALAMAGAWLHGVWTSVPQRNADFAWLEV